MVWGSRDALIRDVENYLRDSWDIIKTGYYLVQELKQYEGSRSATLRRAGLLTSLNSIILAIQDDLREILGRRFMIVGDELDTICAETYYHRSRPGPEIGCYTVEIISGFSFDHHFQVEFYFDENRPIIHMYFNHTVLPEDLVDDEDEEEEANLIDEIRRRFTLLTKIAEFPIPESVAWKMFLPNPILVKTTRRVEDRTINIMVGQKILLARSWNRNHYAVLRLSVPYTGDSVIVDYWMIVPKGTEIPSQVVFPPELLKDILSDLRQKPLRSKGDNEENYDRRVRMWVELTFWEQVLSGYIYQADKLKHVPVSEIITEVQATAERKAFTAYSIYP
ncbi:MAG: hypothetical protein QXM08_01135 [Thermofilaceae archaeon]